MGFGDARMNGNIEMRKTKLHGISGKYWERMGGGEYCVIYDVIVGGGVAVVVNDGIILYLEKSDTT